MVNAMEMLLNAAEKKGKYVAVKDSCKSLTYKDLLVEAYGLSQKISNFVPGKNHLIVIITTKSVESVMAIWGVVCSGNYYVALDSTTPLDRFHRIMDKINPDLVIYTNEKQMEHLNADVLSMVVSDDCGECQEIQFIRQNLSAKHCISQDPLYMVFTSGSTGEPKAIVKNHQSIMAFADSFVSEFGLSSEEHEIFGNQASFDFDVVAKDIYISASIGATLCLIPSNCFLVPAKLSSFLKENKITVLIWAASAVKFVKKLDCFKTVKPEHIRKVFFSGESMTGECIDYWKCNLPGVELVNLYAPSEVTGNCLYHIVSDEKYTGILPLDKVFPNIDVMVLGNNNRPVEDGEKGEIYVRGCFLAQGYYNDMEQTLQRFVQNPSHNHFPDIVYKTGDYAVKNGERFYFAGRIDNQIKHMGHRMELEEIESNCYSVLGCESLCVIYDSIREKIILLTDDISLSYEKLVAGLRQVVPKYMIPHEMLYIDDLPHNDRGKIDRNRARKIYEVIKNE